MLHKEAREAVQLGIIYLPAVPNNICIPILSVK